MNTTISVRLDEKTNRMISRLALARGKTKSELIREALELLVEQHGHQGSPRSPYASLRHLIGCATGGPPNLSVKTGEKFRRILQKRRVSHQ